VLLAYIVENITKAAAVARGRENKFIFSGARAEN
jgi:hypothetical protein